MIELPEARILAKQLNETVGGKKITRIIPAQNAHKFAWYAGDPGEYPELLEGCVIHDVYNTGGMVEADLGGIFMVFSEGIILRLHDGPDTVPAKHQFYAEFENGRILTAGIQMYGGICCFREGEYDNKYYFTAREKPDPFTDGFTFEYFSSLFSSCSPKISANSAKAFLATEQRIPGLGNGVLQDILYNAGVHPKRKMGTLSGEEFRNLYNRIKETLSEMEARGGRNTEKDLFGEPGRYGTKMSRLTMGQPCGTCGTTIEKKPYMGGAVYFCPKCQPL
ncbi:MAG: endonuclease VIII [Spirochaetia bacterium]